MNFGFLQNFFIFKKETVVKIIVDIVPTDIQNKKMVQESLEPFFNQPKNTIKNYTYCYMRINHHHNLLPYSLNNYE